MKNIRKCQWCNTFEGDKKADTLTHVNGTYLLCGVCLVRFNDIEAKVLTNAKVDCGGMSKIMSIISLFAEDLYKRVISKERKTAKGIKVCSWCGRLHGTNTFICSECNDDKRSG